MPHPRDDSDNILITHEMRVRVSAMILQEAIEDLTELGESEEAIRHRVDLIFALIELNTD